VEKGHWDINSNQRKFFDGLASLLNIRKPQDWEHITTKLVLESGGSFVNSHYNGSLQRGK
jgi:hypothetical protein